MENKLVNEIIEQFLESDEYYQGRSTSIKSSRQLREEHREKLKEQFKFKSFEQKIQLGFETIYQGLPLLLSQIDWRQVSNELDRMHSQNREAYILAMVPKLDGEEELVTMQALFGISDQSLKSIYTLGTRLLDERKTVEAEAVFTVLAFLNPQVPEYLIGTASALYWQGKYEEALSCLDYTKILQPDKGISFIYSALCKAHLGDLYTSDSDLINLERIFRNSKEEKLKWEKIYNSITMKVRR